MNKKFLLPIFLLAILTSSLIMVSAAATIKLNVTNFTNISTSTYVINATILGGGQTAGTNGTANVTFYYQPWSYVVANNSFSAANGSWIQIAKVVNTTPDQWYFTYTWDTTALSDATNYTLNATAYNITGNIVNATNSTRNITIDNTAPSIVVYTGAALTTYPNGTSIKTAASLANNLTLNISITDAIFQTNSSKILCMINVDGQQNNTVIYTDNGWCNSSDINITGLSDGNKTIRIYVNDSLNNMRLNSTLVVQIDTTAPVTTATCSPTSVSAGNAFPCTCSATDATSGVASSSGSSTSNSITDTSKTGTFTYTCSATDNAAWTASSSATYSVNQLGAGTPAGSSTGSTATTTKKATSTANEINPGAATVMKYADPAIGVKQISIEVNNKAQNVQITVTKEAGKPANVSVAKSGKVYQYLHIEPKNLADKLSNATVEFKVDKTWVTNNSLTKDKIAVSKFDDTAKKWNELTTTYVSEDASYYYYNVEMASFSYFAISEKGVAATGAGTDTTGSDTGGKTVGSLTWLWILIAVVVLALIGWVAFKKKSQ